MKIEKPNKLKFPLIINNLNEYNRFKFKSIEQLDLNNYDNNWFPVKLENDFPCVVVPVYHHELRKLVLNFKFEKDYFYYTCINKINKLSFQKQKEIWELIK